MIQQNNPETADQIDEFISRLDKYIAAEEEILPFNFTIDDPAGNSYIMNPFFPQSDPNLKAEKYNRSIEQIKIMGYEVENADMSVVNTEEEKNNAVHEKFKTMQGKGSKRAELIKMAEELQMDTHDHTTAKYSAKDTENMFKKAQEIAKNKVYSAHKVDFSQPLDHQDVEGTLS